MKKVCLLLILFLFSSCALAQKNDEIVLDLNDSDVNLSSQNTSEYINKSLSAKKVFLKEGKNVNVDNQIDVPIVPLLNGMMDLDLGSEQSFSNGNQPANSQIDLGAKIRF